MKLANAVWGSDASWATIARGLLAPASVLYRGVIALRNSLYDRGTLTVERSAIPALSVGNLAVGGTGKTPVAAWIASELRNRGARPAVVLRGYGDDEPRVHAMLNPDIAVIANADRIAGVNDAARGGADVAVLDDAFQHRRIARVEDIVLVSADRWREPLRLLPAGPWRESPGALGRASLLIVTRKAATADDARSLLQRLLPLTRRGWGAVAELALAELRHAVTGATQMLSDMRGRRVLVIAGIADPASLASQLKRIGVEPEMRVFPDHHSYDSTDIIRLADEARTFDYTVCTLKDAVKLGPQWPREAPSLWYVSLRCGIEYGSADVSAMFDRVCAARSSQLR
ncbi:MAG TPA: tetraacyldisaccharide 4'-kinase [Gemmatimonadaceae bacterium]|nr:tetraacyldisaccharide 4'-kinase [Gemmatimonadaceae bacterium]